MTGARASGRGRMLDQRLRRAVWLRDGRACRLCGKPVRWEDLHVDHIRPRSRGGPDTMGNLRAAHSWCNERRGTRDVPEHRGLSLVQVFGWSVGCLGVLTTTLLALAVLSRVIK